MKSLDEQFADVLRAYPGASLTAMGNGVYQVLIPVMPLPAGWNQITTEVRFVVPNGYPFAAPDCFWADPSLRLANSAMPQNAQIGQPNPGQPDPGKLWFSWHLQTPWNPSNCILTTYVNVIRRRFEAVQ